MKKQTTKKRTIKPTFKQKAVFDKLVENGGNISKTMVEAGYTKATAKTPQKLTESIGWKQLMDKHMADEKLARLHEEGLVTKDLNTRHRYLETAYKLKKKYEEQPPQQNVQVNIQIL